MKAFLSLMVAVAVMAFAPTAQAEHHMEGEAMMMKAPVVGQPAPEFTAVDSNGMTHNLSDFKGKYVVLEWSNKDCPFVKKHYESGNMQKLQKQAGDDVVWLTVLSSAEGKQGHLSGEEANANVETTGAAPTAVLMDASGEIGKAYDAKTTPHMFVIDKDGVLRYAGAIDSNASPSQSAIATSTNYVTAALDALRAGQDVEVSQTQAYGCGVKY